MSDSATWTSSRNSLRPAEGEAGHRGRRHQHRRVGARVEGVLGPGQALQLAAGLGEAGTDRSREPVVLEEEPEGRSALWTGRHGPAEGLVGRQRAQDGHPVDHVIGVVAPPRMQILRTDVEYPGGEIGPFEILADGEERHGLVAAHRPEHDAVDPLGTGDDPAQPLDPTFARTRLVEIVQAGQPEVVGRPPTPRGVRRGGRSAGFPGRTRGHRGWTTGSCRCGAEIR